MARRTPIQATLPFAARPERAPTGAAEARAARAPRRHVPSEAPSGLVLRKSPARLKLEALEKENQRLLREIEKRKLSCEATEHTVRDAHDAVHARAEPLRATVFALLREIHAIFDQLLGPQSSLSRSERAALRRFHGQIISGLPHPDAEGESPEPEAGPSGRGAASSAASEDWAGSASDAEHASAHKPSQKNTDLLRTLYRKLAVALHPDKASDAAEAARLTSLMKEVTRAYANEDLAKLVELDRCWLAQAPAGDDDAEAQRRTERLLAANTELRRQLRSLTARLQQLKQSLPGMPWPRGRAAASGADLAAGMIASIEREVKDIERLRDAARDLQAGRIDVSGFLAGPRSAAEEELDPLSDLFEQMIEELLEGSDIRERRGRGRRRR
jgi:hypothetical protein